MLVPYKELPGSARVWIYQSDRLLGKEEVEQINAAGQLFVQEWTAHNQTLKASFEVLQGLFLAIFVDESHNDASGCSIDKSVRFIQQQEQLHHISLMNRMLFAYKQGDTINLSARDAFEKLYKEGAINDNTIVFNNLVQTKSELEAAWALPLGKSWHKQMV